MMKRKGLSGDDMENRHLTSTVGETAAIAFIIGVVSCGAFFMLWDTIKGDFMRGFLAGGFGVAILELIILKIGLGWGPRKTDE